MNEPGGNVTVSGHFTVDLAIWECEPGESYEDAVKVMLRDYGLVGFEVSEVRDERDEWRRP